MAAAVLRMSLSVLTAAVPLKLASTPRAKTACWAIVVFALALIAQATFMTRYVGAYDEGLVLFGAARVAQGEVPYRDFWTMYGPASFYVLAAVYQVLGETVLAARTYDLAVRALIVTLVFLLARRRGGGLIGATIAVVCMGQLIAVSSHGFPVFPATAAALFALWAVAHTERTSRGWAWAALAGVGVGLSTTYRHDMGFYAALACVYALWSLQRTVNLRTTRPSLTTCFAVGWSTVMLPVTAFLLWQVPLSDLHENLIRVPFEVYPGQRSLPFPSVAGSLQHALEQGSVKPLFGLVIYLPLLILCAGAAVALRDRWFRGHPPLRGRDIVLESWVLLGLLFYLKGVVRVELRHVMPSLIIALPVAAALLMRLHRPWLKGALLFSLVAVTGAKTAAWRLPFVPPPTEVSTTAPSSWLADELGCPASANQRLRCFDIDSSRQAVLQYLATQAEPGDSLYVGTGRHDKLFVNNVELYFLSGMRAATRWHDLHPGVQTTVRVQLEMIEEMKRRPPRFVVLNSEWDNWDEPNASRLSSGVTLLDAYLHGQAHYQPVFHSGPLTIYDQPEHHQP